MSRPIGILSIEPKILWSQNTALGSMGSYPKNGYEMVWSRKEACGSMGSSIQNEHMEPEIAWWIHNRRVHFWRMFEHPVDEFRREATTEPQTTVWLHTARLHFMVDP